MIATIQQISPLIEDALAAGARVRMTVRGQSMRPFVLDGDVVELAAAGLPAPGDILLVRRASGDFVLHRVSRVTPAGFFLRGDAQSVEEGPLAPEQIVARAAGLVRGGRLIPLDRGIRRRLGRLWHATRPLHPLLIPPLRAAKRLLSLG